MPLPLDHRTLSDTQRDVIPARDEEDEDSILYGDDPMTGPRPGMGVRPKQTKGPYRTPVVNDPALLGDGCEAEEENQGD